MNNSLETLLCPLLDKFHSHVGTDPEEQLGEWVKMALELSQPIHRALTTQYFLGYEMVSLEHSSDLEKVLLHLFRYRAREEQNMPFLLSDRLVEFTTLEPATAGLQLHIHGLKSGSITYRIGRSTLVGSSILRYLKITPSSTGHTLAISVPSKYPMVYTLEAVRRFLNNIEGVSAEWEGEDGWRPDLGLEIAVAGIEGQEYRKKFLLDSVISSQLGDGKMLYSRLDSSTHTYRAVISDPMDVDHLLSVPIPLAKDDSGGYCFELMLDVGRRHAALNLSSDIMMY